MNIANYDSHWFALNVYGNKVLALDEILRKMEIETYVPIIERVKASRDGEPKIVTVPAVSRLMFVHTSAPRILEIEHSSILDFHIYRTLESNPFDRRLIEIPDREMQTFILVSSSGSKGLEYFADGRMEFKHGSRVRVIKGPFKGCEGHIKRIKGNRRLVVEIQGVCAVATSYIPSPSLESLPD